MAVGVASKAEAFKQLVQGSNRILVTSHISPDPDAVSSVLLLGRTIEANFPDKELRMALEERPNRDISFLAGYNQIHFGPLLAATESFNPDLFIIVDAMNYSRVARVDGQALKDLIEQSKAKLAIIDHHTEAGLENNELYINQGMAATALELYLDLFEELKLKKPADFAETALMGIITDTARHRYDDPHHRDTHRVVSDLLDAGASIEKIENRLDRYSAAEMKALADLAANMTGSPDGYNYTYISDKLAAEDYNQQAFKMACEVFTSQFIRNFEDNHWGFIVYPEMIEDKKSYSVSFRSVSGGMDVAELAGKLGGGGHKQAAGAKNIPGQTVAEAVKAVQAVIEAAG